MIQLPTEIIERIIEFAVPGLKDPVRVLAGPEDDGSGYTSNARYNEEFDEAIVCNKQQLERLELISQSLTKLRLVSLQWRHIIDERYLAKKNRELLWVRLKVNLYEPIKCHCESRLRASSPWSRRPLSDCPWEMWQKAILSDEIRSGEMEMAFKIWIDNGTFDAFCETFSALQNAVSNYDALIETDFNSFCTRCEFAMLDFNEALKKMTGGKCCLDIGNVGVICQSCSRFEYLRPKRFAKQQQQQEEVKCLICGNVDITPNRKCRSCVRVCECNERSLACCGAFACDECFESKKCSECSKWWSSTCNQIVKHCCHV